MFPKKKTVEWKILEGPMYGIELHGRPDVRGPALCIDTKGSFKVTLH